MSKAAFVRARTKLSPKEIVAHARSVGLKLDVGYVYNVRRGDKAKRKAAARKASPLVVAKPKRPSSVSSPVSTSGSNEEEFLKIVAAEVGLGRAIEVLQAERSRVTAMLGG